MTTETVRWHRCRCVRQDWTHDRCRHMVPLDQPVCDECEEWHGPRDAYRILALGEPWEDQE